MTTGAESGVEEETVGLVAEKDGRNFTLELGAVSGQIVLEGVAVHVWCGRVDDTRIGGGGLLKSRDATKQFAGVESVQRPNALTAKYGRLRHFRYAARSISKSKKKLFKMDKLKAKFSSLFSSKTASSTEEKSIHAPPSQFSPPHHSLSRSDRDTLLISHLIRRSLSHRHQYRSFPVALMPMLLDYCNSCPGDLVITERVLLQSGLLVVEHGNGTDASPQTRLTVGNRNRNREEEDNIDEEYRVYNRTVMVAAAEGFGHGQWEIVFRVACVGDMMHSGSSIVCVCVGV